MRRVAVVLGALTASIGALIATFVVLTAPVGQAQVAPVPPVQPTPAQVPTVQAPTQAPPAQPPTAQAPAVQPAPAQAPLTQSRAALRVYVGQGTGSIAQEDFVGDPIYGGNGVRVAQGTTVTWAVESDELHTVTFPGNEPIPNVFIPQPEDPSRPGMLNPQLLLASLPTGAWDGSSFISAELPTDLTELSITFSRIGKYNYLCLYHVGMVGSVEVVPPGTPGITTQAAIDAQASALDAIRQGQADLIYATRNRPTRIEGPRGADLWFVRAGTDWRGENLDIQAFLPSALTVGQGDTVAWYVDHLQPHTVTFRANGANGPPANLFQLQLPDGTILTPPAPGSEPPPELLAALEDPNSAPRLVFGNGALRTNNPIYDGQGMYSSGLIGEHPRITVPMEKVWALTFNTPGTFQYVCLLHEEQGMKGTITVQAR